MKQEMCYGIIPFTTTQKVLLILHRKGEYWGFPKGHHEEGESPHETATRELHEETGLEITRYLNPEPPYRQALPHEEWMQQQERYTLNRNGEPVEKIVTYFPALVEGTLLLNHQSYEDEDTEGEIQQGKWCSFDEASQLITHPPLQEIYLAILSRVRPLL